MILTPQDKDIYFPSVCLEGASLLGAIRLTEGIAQGMDGSNRFLEPTEYTEERTLDAFNRSIHLRYFPIIPNTISVATVQQSGRDGFGRRVSSANRLLTSNEFTLKNQQVFLNSDSFVSKVLVTYKAGFDFEGDDTPDTIQIRAALGALLEHRLSFAGQGLTRIDGLGVSLNSPQVGNNPENLMQVFRQYRPHS